MLEVNAYAKINLSLDVLSKRKDGYHDLQMIMQTISLSDKIILGRAPYLTLSCSTDKIPTDSRNIVWKAAEMFFKITGIKDRASIHIDKKIPVAAGLAGGSSNAAAALTGLNELFKTGLTLRQLAEEGKKLGADVPYCIFGGTMLAEGIGEKLLPLGSLEGMPVLLVKPKFDVSTAWVYRNLDLTKEQDRPDTKFLLDCVEKKDIIKIACNMKNVLESVTINRHSEIMDIKMDMINNGALGSLMSGSGPSVFGLYKDTESAQRAYNQMKDRYNEIYLVSTVDGREKDGKDKQDKVR